MKRILPFTLLVALGFLAPLAIAQQPQPGPPDEELIQKLKDADEAKARQAAEQEKFAEQELEDARKKAALGQGPIGVPGVKPALTFDEPVRDLGRISDDEPVRIVFTFTNTSDKPVKVQNISASCGCTVPQKTAKDIYQPGESGEVVATYNPAGRRGRETKHVYVDTDFDKSPRSELVFSVDTLARVLIEPPSVSMNDVVLGESRSQVVTITGREPGFDVTDLRTADNSTTFKVVRQERAEIKDALGATLTRVRYTIELAPGLPLGQYQAGITGSTTDPKRPNISFQARAYVVGNIRSVPDRVWLVSQQGGQPWFREFNIDHRRGKAFHITSVEAVDAPADLRMVYDLLPAAGQTESADGLARYVLKVSGTTPFTAGQLAGKIIVRTTLPDQPVIELPVQGSIQVSSPDSAPQQ